MTDSKDSGSPRPPGGGDSSTGGQWRAQGDSSFNTGQAFPPPPPPPPFPPVGYPPGGNYPPPQPNRGGGVFRKIGTSLAVSVILGSVALNIWLGVFFVSSMAAGPEQNTYVEGDRNQRIVILPVKGAITDETYEFVHEAVKLLSKDKPKAVVLRVDSPGGGVSASDRIWNDLNRFREETKVPIIASYGSVAASGGYYVSALADHIVAEPTSITGSIGVIAQGFTLERLLDKIGVTPQVHHSTHADMKDSLSMVRSWKQSDVDLLVGILDSAHDRFVQVVAEGRKKHLTLAEIQQGKLDSGEPFTTKKALENKLVDAEGYLSDAITKAKELAGIGKDVTPWVVVMGPRKNIFGMLGASGAALAPVESITGDQIRGWLTELSVPKIEYRWSP